MRYVEARIEEYRHEKAYRIYVTKSLQLAPQNRYLKVQYDDMLKPQKEDLRTGNEIVADIMKRAGLNFG